MQNGAYKLRLCEQFANDLFKDIVLGLFRVLELPILIEIFYNRSVSWIPVPLYELSLFMIALNLRHLAIVFQVWPHGSILVWKDKVKYSISNTLHVISSAY